MAGMPRKLATLGPVVVDRITQQQALANIDALIDAQQGGFVVTPNIDHIVLANRDPALAQVYSRSRLSVADGTPLLWMARALGTPVPEKISGSDFIFPLMSYASENARKVFLFGASPDVSAEAERRLLIRYPQLRIVGRDCSFWSADAPQGPGESLVVRAIRDSGADLVVVALGSPKQELWMVRHEHAIAPAIALGLGASLDFVAGAVRRAPAWMSRAGLEWVFRLVQEPRRLAYRYLVRDLQIFPIFAGDLYRTVLRRPRTSPLSDSEVNL